MKSLAVPSFRVSQRARLWVSAASLLALCVCTSTFATDAHAQAANTTAEATPLELRDVGITEKLDSQVPLDAAFKDENGQSVRLGDLVDGKRPTLLTFAYFSCPVLCSLILNSADESLSKINWTIGKEFDVVTISIDPNDTPEKARDKKASLLSQYKTGGANKGANAANAASEENLASAAKGWHFLTTTDTATIKRVTDSVGYRFKYDQESKQYGHPGALMMLKPSGQVARYLYGLEYPPNDVKLALLEASEGKSISTGEQIMLFCYKYSANEGKYVLIANRVMRIGGGFFAACLAFFLITLWRREKHRKPSAPNDAADVDTTSTATDANHAGDALKASVLPMENRT